MVEQTANIDTRQLQHVPASVGKPKQYNSYPVQICDMEGTISRDTVMAVQAHHRSTAAQNGSNGFAIVTDSHLGKWKFLIRDQHQAQTFFGITYRCTSQEHAETCGKQALQSIIELILD